MPKNDPVVDGPAVAAVGSVRRPAAKPLMGQKPVTARHAHSGSFEQWIIENKHGDAKTRQTLEEWKPLLDQFNAVPMGGHRRNR